MKALAIYVAVALAGCGGGSGKPDGMEPDAGVDADPTPRPCWPEIAPTPQGSAVLGTGRESFETMPDVLPLEYGTQDGFMLFANVRMTGFAPGNPQDILDPRNPRTRIRAYFDETNVPLNYYAKCPFRTAYEPFGGEYALIEGAGVVFETCWRSEHLFGKKIRIEMDLMDDSGGHARDVKVVTAGPPIGFYPVDQGTPGCIH